MATAKSEQPTVKALKVSALDFDKKNPRFPPDIAEGSQAQLLERFVRDERLLEVIESIADQGYFPGEPLLVVPAKNGHYTVVEGNRRLAALKLLSGELEPPQGRLSIENAVKSAKHRPNSVPCLLFKREDQILRYLGFRHITGIKAWSALQKARYVQRLRTENYAAKSTEESVRLLARETGSKPGYVGQMLSALALYDKAEAANFFGLRLEPAEIDFSILSTALSYSNIVDYVGLESRLDLDQRKVKTKSLENLFLWLFVARSNQKSVVGESRNLKKLAAIVASPEAIKELLQSGNLDEAFEFSKGPGVALMEALMQGEKRLNAAWGWIPKVTDIDSEHEERSKSIAHTANSIHTAILTQNAARDASPRISTKRIKRTSRK